MSYTNFSMITFLFLRFVQKPGRTFLTPSFSTCSRPHSQLGDKLLGTIVENMLMYSVVLKFVLLPRTVRRVGGRLAHWLALRLYGAG